MNGLGSSGSERHARHLLLVAMMVGGAACPRFKADVEPLPAIRERPVYRVACPNVPYDCTLAIGEVCKHGEYRRYRCRENPLTMLAICATPSDNVDSWKSPALERLTRCDGDAAIESIETDDVRHLELWSPENLERMRVARGAQLRADRQRLPDVAGRPLFSATCPGAVGLDCLLVLADACAYRGYRWYQCQKQPVKMLALCGKEGDKLGRLESEVMQLPGCGAQAVERALKTMD